MTELTRTDEDSLGASDSPRRGGQFSLRTLLLLPVAVAVPCALVFTTSPSVVMPAAIACGLIVPGILMTVIVYGSESKRAFCIGAIFPAGALAIGSAIAMIFFVGGWTGMGNLSEENVSEVRWVFGAGWLIIFVAGGVCVGVRWLMDATGARK